MRLICGLLNLDQKPASQEITNRMVRAMIAPDLAPRVKVSTDGSISLAVIDFSPPKDALTLGFDPGERSLIAADVRFDEPLLLARKLSINSGPVEHLLVAALQRWGLDAPHHIVGDFAFAEWDQQRRTMLCARDPLGIRPFSYTYRPGKWFAFASLPKALYESGLVERRLDMMAFAGQIVHSWRADHSIFHGISRLPPGHTLEVGPRGMSVQRYWHAKVLGSGVRSITQHEAAEQLRSLISEAVRSRLPTAGPVGAHLSGGLDSSAIAVLAARILRDESRSLRTYSFLSTTQSGVVFDDEEPFVRSVLQQEPDIHWTAIRNPTVSRWVNARMDEARVLSIEPDDPENMICADASAHGVSAVLSGWGGDEGATFNGRGALAEALLAGHWHYFVKEVCALARIRQWSVMGVLRSEVWEYVNFSHQLPSLILRLRSALASPILERDSELEAYSYVMGPNARLNRYRLISGPLIAERAEDWATIGARHGIAFLFPMLDVRVVEFVLSLPSKYFLCGGFKRRVFRDAMAEILPDQIRWRQWKLMPFPEQLLAIVEGQTEIRRSLGQSSRSPGVKEIFNIEALHKLVDEFPSASSMRSGEYDDASALPVATMLLLLPSINYIQQHH